MQGMMSGTVEAGSVTMISDMQSPSHARKRNSHVVPLSSAARLANIVAAEAWTKRGYSGQSP